jgi:hypothetical protein
MSTAKPRSEADVDAMTRDELIAFYQAEYGLPADEAAAAANLAFRTVVPDVVAGPAPARVLRGAQGKNTSGGSYDPLPRVAKSR